MGKGSAKAREGSACGYSIMKRRGGIEIVMDCARCNAEPSLESHRCFSNVMAAIQREGSPLAITLRSHVERRYGPSATSSLVRVAEVLNKIDSLVGQLEMESRNGEACSSCARPLIGKLGLASSRVVGMDINSAVAMAWEFERDELGSAKGSCGDCKGMTKVQLVDIAKALREMEKAAARSAIRITEAEQ